MSLEKEIRNLFINNTLNGLKTPLYYLVWILGGFMLGFLLTACGGDSAPSRWQFFSEYLRLSGLLPGGSSKE